MSAAFKISAEEPTSFRTLQDDEPCLIYTFLDYDNEMDEEIEIHFVWTGKVEDAVQVFSRERGEPKVMFLIEENDIRPLTAEEMLTEFKLVCDKWVATVFNVRHGMFQ